MKWVWVVVLIGCGPASFAGRYNGSLDSVGTCEDGSSGTDTVAVRWIVSESTTGTTLTAPTLLGSCGPIKATVASQNTLELAAKTCASVGDVDLMSTDTVKSGSTLKLNGDKLTVAIGVFSRLRYGTGKLSSCSGDIVGVLTRMEE